MSAGVSVLFGVGVTAARRRRRRESEGTKNRFRRGATIVSGQSYYAPSSPLLFSSSFESSGRIGRWIDPKVQVVGIFWVEK